MKLRMVERATLHLVVARVEESLFDGAALSATLPTTAGEITILPHHEPLVATLGRGNMLVKTSIEEKEFAIEGGVLEISNNCAVVLL